MGLPDTGEAAFTAFLCIGLVVSVLWLNHGFINEMMQWAIDEYSI